MLVQYFVATLIPVYALLNKNLFILCKCQEGISPSVLYAFTSAVFSKCLPILCAFVYCSFVLLCSLLHLIIVQLDYYVSCRCMDYMEKGASDGPSDCMFASAFCNHLCRAELCNSGHAATTAVG